MTSDVENRKPGRPPKPESERKKQMSVYITPLALGSFDGLRRVHPHLNDSEIMNVALVEYAKIVAEARVSA
jgi:hypothetical protein